MVDFIEKNHLLCGNQHGFRSGRSCLTQLLSHVDLDLAKAFDKVDHRLLLLKMERMGFHENLVKWIESFLSDREQRVVLDGVSSLTAIILSGMPQGTVLGPLLFIIFINDMQLCVTGSIIRFFADDTRILWHIFNMVDTEILQQDLNSVVRRAKCNNMALHEDKFELLVHKHFSQNALDHLPFAILGQTYAIKSLMATCCILPKRLKTSGLLSQQIYPGAPTSIPSQNVLAKLLLGSSVRSRPETSRPR